MEENKINASLRERIKNGLDSIARMTLSRSTGGYDRIKIRPIVLKNRLYFQEEIFVRDKVFHENILKEEFLSKLEEDMKGFLELNIRFFSSELTAKFGGGKWHFKEKELDPKLSTSLDHDRAKEQLIKDGDKIPALIDLGIFDKDFKVLRSAAHKLKQINNFLGKIDEVFKYCKSDEVKIVDFGSGKAYLSFLLYHYFSVVRGKRVSISGYDIKEDVVEMCNLAADRYGYKNLKFYINDVTKGIPAIDIPDIVVSLHACDTLTDYALEYAIKNSVKFIFSVPCCQHEINSQIAAGGYDFDIFMRHGLLKERFSALLTDAIRVNMLESFGYEVNVLEVAGFDITPKNLMIRAVKKKNEKNLEIEDSLAKYSLRHTLVELFKKNRRV